MRTLARHTCPSVTGEGNIFHATEFLPREIEEQNRGNLLSCFGVSHFGTRNAM